MRKPLKIKLTVPEPCLENWEKMTPDEKGRFCAKCQTSVTDFTNFSEEQLYALLINKKGKTCGRFTENQLNKFIAPVPSQRSYSRFPQVVISTALTVSIANAADAKEFHHQNNITQTSLQNTHENQEDLPSGDTLHFIKGKIIEQKTKEPVMGANVELFNVRGSSIGRAVTDEDGNFIISNFECGYDEIIMINVIYKRYKPIITQFNFTENINLTIEISQQYIDKTSLVQSKSIENMVTGGVSIVPIDPNSFAKKILIDDCNIKNRKIEAVNSNILQRETSWQRFKHIFQKKQKQ